MTNIYKTVLIVTVFNIINYYFYFSRGVSQIIVSGALTIVLFEAVELLIYHIASYLRDEMDEK